MSTPPPTKRDQRRVTRREQLQQKQAERQRARERARRMQLIRRGSFIGAGVLLVVLLAVIAHSAFFPSPVPYPTSPATGDTVANIPCGGNEVLTVHYHASLQLYVNGQPQQVPAGVGIVQPDYVTQQSPHLASNGTTSCFYYLHTHDTSGIVHIESPDNNQYVLGQFFQIWGQRLSKTQVMDNKVDAAHQLRVVLFGGNGKMTTYTGDPAQIALSAHETIVLLYNSPHVTPAAYTNWGNL
jgi:hypothetical protein